MKEKTRGLLFMLIDFSFGKILVSSGLCWVENILVKFVFVDEYLKIICVSIGKHVLIRIILLSI